MPTQPDQDVVDTLETAAIGLTKGLNLFRGPVRTASASSGVPHEAVFALVTGGSPPTFYQDGSNEDFRISTVQVVTRSEPNKFDDGQALARAVRNALHKQPALGYIDCVVRESEPLYLEQDEAGHYEWAINLEMKHAQA